MYYRPRENKLGTLENPNGVLRIPALFRTLSFPAPYFLSAPYFYLEPTLGC